MHTYPVQMWTEEFGAQAIELTGAVCVFKTAKGEDGILHNTTRHTNRVEGEEKGVYARRRSYTPRASRVRAQARADPPDIKNEGL